MWTRDGASRVNNKGRPGQRLISEEKTGTATEKSSSKWIESTGSNNKQKRCRIRRSREREFRSAALAQCGKRTGTPTPQSGGAGSGRRKWLPPRSIASTDDQPPAQTRERAESGSGTAGTRARLRDSHQDRRPPSPFPTSRADPPRNPGWSPHIQTNGTSRMNHGPGPAVLRDDRAGVVSKPTDPGHPRAVPYHPAPALVGAHDSVGQP